MLICEFVFKYCRRMRNKMMLLFVLSSEIITINIYHLYPIKLHFLSARLITHICEYCLSSNIVVPTSFPIYLHTQSQTQTHTQSQTQSSIQ